eukprot:Skav210504  [mRNA]  locus=scaffold601:393827:399177:+ [translate_table: standard]
MQQLLCPIAAEVRRLLDELLEIKLENCDLSCKSHARRNLLSVLVDADITLDSSLRICAPSNKAQHFLAQDLTEKTSLEGHLRSRVVASTETQAGLKFHHLVAEADRSKLREFLNRAARTVTNSHESSDLQSESSASMHGGETGRLLQIFHASIPVEGEEMKKQPRHLVGLQDPDGPRWTPMDPDGPAQL